MSGLQHRVCLVLCRLVSMPVGEALFMTDGLAGFCVHAWLSCAHKVDNNSRRYEYCKTPESRVSSASDILLSHQRQANNQTTRPIHFIPACPKHIRPPGGIRSRGIETTAGRAVSNPGLSG
ncbi:unnamed protein product [Protopolystoma xenopodis]|uniref:Secreted protein n=1 Tax=Protopolystoma xenopodis TaxID=117903 RepID=A0A448WHE0_9PLAT|nr:unnamed protein product [Protopolystoma xenopodis]